MNIDYCNHSSKLAGSTFDTNSIEQVRKKITQMSHETIDSNIIKVYGKLRRVFLKDQFISKEFSSDSLDNWKKVSNCLEFEKNVEEIQRRKINGCMPIYFFTALEQFLVTSSKHKVTNPLIEDVIRTSLQKLSKSLNVLLKILSLIDGLKILTFSKEIDFPKNIENLIKNSLIKKMNNEEEILIPLGWLLLTPLNGHLILLKMKRLSDDIHLKIFNCTPRPSDPILKEKIIENEKFLKYRISTSLAFSYKLSNVELFLKKIYNLLSLQQPDYFLNYLNINVINPRVVNSDIVSLLATKTHYALLGDKNSVIEQKITSPLENMSYLDGNCVIASFRMLFYTMVKEIAAQQKIPLELHDLLKSEADHVIELFKKYTIEKLAVLNKF